MGARFADVNGDGLVDFVYYRWINSKKQQKGAYINSGCGWRSEPQYTPLYHIAADGYGDRGARFVELNGDGATDLAYHQLINSAGTTQKGAYLGKYYRPCDLRRQRDDDGYEYNAIDTN